MNGMWQGGQFVLQSTIEERLARVTAERDRLREALRWYEKVVGECNRRGRAGDDARHTLARDIGAKARAALQEDRDE